MAAHRSFASAGLAIAVLLVPAGCCPHQGGLLCDHWLSRIDHALLACSGDCGGCGSCQVGESDCGPTDTCMSCAPPGDCECAGAAAEPLYNDPPPVVGRFHPVPTRPVFAPCDLMAVGDTTHAGPPLEQPPTTASPSDEPASAPTAEGDPAIEPLDADDLPPPQSPPVQPAPTDSQSRWRPHRPSEVAT